LTPRSNSKKDFQKLASDDRWPRSVSSTLFKISSKIMAMTADFKLELRAACPSVARETTWDAKPVDPLEAEILAERFFQEAMECLEVTASDGRDRMVVVRAIKYLEACVAMPPMFDHVRWFQEALFVLLNLAWPSKIDSDALPFLSDVESGIAELRKAVSEI
jgi:hypothetical protein